jgi:hypothetical protein
MTIPNNIRNMAIEATCQQNDGWTMQAYRLQLLEIRDYINQVLGEDDDKLPTNKQPPCTKNHKD